MSAESVVLQGTVLADGTLRLPGAVPLPPGPVEVVVRPVNAKRGEGAGVGGAGANRRRARSDPRYVPRTAEEIDASIREMRDEWDEQSREIQAIQEQCRLERIREAKKGKPS